MPDIHPAAMLNEPDQSKPFFILFVEDDPIQSELIGIACSKAGIPKDGFKIVSDVESAKSFLNQKIPQLIVADMNLPGCNGLDLLEWARARPELSALPFYIWTYRPPPELRKQAKAFGCTDVLERFETFSELCGGLKTLKAIHS